MNSVTQFAPNRVFLDRPKPPGTLMLLPFMALIVVSYASLSIPLMGITLLFGSWLVIAHLPLWDRIERRERKILLLFACVIAATLPISVIRSEVAILHFIVIMVSLGSAFVATRDLTAYCFALRTTLLLFLIGIYLYLFINGLNDFPLENVLPDQSSNVVTSGLVFLQASYCAVHYLIFRRPVFITPILTFVICLIGVGRGSILASALIILINGISFLSLRHGFRAVLATLIASVLVGVTMISFNDQVFDFISSKTKLGSGLYDYHRERMIYEYLAAVDAKTLLTGADYRATVIEYAYKGNPHNSFIRAHHIFGLPYLLAMAAFPFFFLSKQLSVGRSVFAFGMLTVIYFRALTEPIIFPTVFDFFFFSTCFAFRAKLTA